MPFPIVSSSTLYIIPYTYTYAKLLTDFLLIFDMSKCSAGIKSKMSILRLQCQRCIDSYVDDTSSSNNATKKDRELVSSPCGLVYMCACEKCIMFKSAGISDILQCFLGETLMLLGSYVLHCMFFSSFDIEYTFCIVIVTHL